MKVDTKDLNELDKIKHAKFISRIPNFWSSAEKKNIEGKYYRDGKCDDVRHTDRQRDGIAKIMRKFWT